MKKLTVLLLSCAFFLTGCSAGQAAEQITEAVTAAVTLSETASETVTETISEAVTETASETEAYEQEAKIEIPDYISLDDPNLESCIRDSIYTELVTQLDSEDYFVENVSALYFSKEYLEEVLYNSQSDVYFGYTLEELDAQFQGKKYVFDLGDDGQTVVHEFEEYDDTYEKVIKNVAIGTGVILVCVTVSAVTVGAPAVSAIFAVSAKSGAAVALSSGVIGGAAAGIVKSVETGDPEQAFKAAALEGSESFKWGAIGGSVAGGVGETAALHGATFNGLTMNEAALIQKESKYPLDVIKQFKSMDEYNIYKNAGLKTQMVNGKLALVRDIDLNFKSALADGTEVTNLERMARGLAPLDPATGKKYQLHHINQDANGTLAILKEAEHQGNAAILNTAGKESEINRSVFDKTREDFWKSLAEIFT